MRISDWSSDVCSSDLIGFARTQADNVAALPFQLKRLGRKRERGGRRDAVKRGGGLRHGHYLRMSDLQAGRYRPGGAALATSCADRKSTRLNSSHTCVYCMPFSA